MIPVIQTKVVVKNSKGEEVVRGNCYAAVIASLMELPITEVPNVEVFFHMKGSFWNEVMLAFINSKGYDLCSDDRFKVFHPELHSQLRCPEDEDFDMWLIKTIDELNGKYYLVTGETVRGFRHVCIYQNGELVHDPHPTKDGLISLDTFQTLELCQTKNQ
jgi:hypothetical protein